MLETRHLRLIIAITALAILLIISATLIKPILAVNKFKPSKPDSSGLESESQADLKWYIKFSVKNQQATAYVGESCTTVS